MHNKAGTSGCDELSARKVICAKRYAVGNGIILNCVGTPETIKMYEADLNGRYDLHPKQILEVIRKYGIYCCPEAPEEREDFVMRFNCELMETNLLIHEKLFDQALEIHEGRESCQKGEEFRKYAESTCWYRNGWTY